jgi:hypothetical protein
VFYSDLSNLLSFASFVFLDGLDSIKTWEEARGSGIFALIPLSTVFLSYRCLLIAISLFLALRFNAFHEYA